MSDIQMISKEDLKNIIQEDLNRLSIELRFYCYSKKNLKNLLKQKIESFGGRVRWGEKNLVSILQKSKIKSIIFYKENSLAAYRNNQGVKMGGSAAFAISRNLFQNRNHQTTAILRVPDVVVGKLTQVDL